MSDSAISSGQLQEVNHLLEVLYQSLGELTKIADFLIAVNGAVLQGRPLTSDEVTRLHLAAARLEAMDLAVAPEQQP